jgi:hypothetical protein
VGVGPPPLQRDPAPECKLQGEPSRFERRAVRAKGGNLRRRRTGVQRAAASREGRRVRGLVGVGLEEKGNRFEGAPASAGFTGVDERRATQGTADGRRNGKARL